MNISANILSADTDAHSNGAVIGTLSFIVPQDEKPYFRSSALTGGDPEVFFQTRNVDVVIHDMRERADVLSLDKEGFELITSPSAVQDFYDDAEIETRYYGEIEALLKDRFGASKVAIFDATRRADSDAGAANPDGQRGPAWRVHVDYTHKSGPQRLSDIFGVEEADRILKSGARVVQVNVWRAIRGPVKRSPLALADASTIAPEELVATDQIFPDRVGEIYNVAHGEGQKWYYAPDMTPDEAILIKGWDTEDDGRALFTPHGAFALPHQVGTPPRESIEIRTMVVIDPA